MDRMIFFEKGTDRFVNNVEKTKRSFWKEPGYVLDSESGQKRSNIYKKTLNISNYEFFWIEKPKFEISKVYTAMVAKNGD